LSLSSPYRVIHCPRRASNRCRIGPSGDSFSIKAIQFHRLTRGCPLGIGPLTGGVRVRRCRNDAPMWDGSARERRHRRDSSIREPIGRYAS
jgi:putative component of membrane protein insertase Oxa1/YidC/SpoIIIJ protein YidD